MAKGFAPMISALADEERRETQDVGLMIEMQKFKADIADRHGHPRTDVHVDMSCFVFIISIFAQKVGFNY